MKRKVNVNFISVIVVTFLLMAPAVSWSADTAAQKPALQKQSAQQPAAQKPVVQKQAVKKKEIKPQKAEEAQKPVKEEPKVRKYFLAFDLGYFIPLQDLGDMVGSQISGRVFFQFRGLYKWFGLGADLGFTQLDDLKYNGNIKFFYFLANPLITFPLGYGFDIQLIGGVGVAAVLAELKEREGSLNKTSGDLMIDVGVNIIKNFLDRYALGIEFKYYHIFEDRNFNAIEASVFFGVKI